MTLLWIKLVRYDSSNFQAARANLHSRSNTHTLPPTVFEQGTVPAARLVLRSGGSCERSVSPWSLSGCLCVTLSDPAFTPRGRRCKNVFLVKLLGWIISLFYLHCFCAQTLLYASSTNPFCPFLLLCYQSYICYFCDNWWVSLCCGFDI